VATMRAMRCFQPTIPLLIGLGGICLGQTVRLAPNVSVAEAEYVDAVAAWSKADPNLARDLLRTPREEMLVRIRRVAALRDEAMDKKQAYLTQLVERIRKAQRQLAERDDDRISTDSLKRSLPGEQARLDAQRANLDALLAALPAGSGDAALRRDLENERSRLTALRSDLAARGEALDALGRTQQALESTRLEADLANRLQNVVAFWDQERDAVERERGDWKEMYRAMERAVEANAGVAPEAPPATGKGRKVPRKKSGQAAKPAAPAN
jgi:chromosome segregation ATPase